MRGSRTRVSVAIREPLLLSNMNVAKNSLSVLWVVFLILTKALISPSLFLSILASRRVMGRSSGSPGSGRVSAIGSSSRFTPR